MDYDIIIIGAGPAGLAFARSVGESGLRVAMVELQERDQLAQPAVDGRDIALTHLSVDILAGLGAWERIGDEQVSPILEARVVDGDSPYRLSFDTPRGATEPLGFLVSNHLLRGALFAVVEPLENVELITGTRVTGVDLSTQRGGVRLEDGRELSAPLIVAADNRFSSTRRMVGIGADMRDFGREAIVGWMEHEQPHENVAHECFHYGRTLAVLPMPGNVSSIVVTAPSDQAEALMDLSPEAYAADIEARLGGELGAMKMVGERHRYPLVAVHARRFVRERFALVGDAAVGMHPVTAHGFNLGLSGQDLLSKQLLQAHRAGRDLGGLSVLRPYERQHMQVSRPLFHGTNGIVGLFTDDRLPAKLLRKAVLRASDHIAPVKWLIRGKLTTKRHGLGFPLPLF
ncbi:MAG: 5-demethoxyubiquinol-8 5-hydroxylase UbiM [Gammaproteobacteria bacterium]